MKELNGIKYIERLPVVMADKTPLFVLIHGYGSNEDDLFSFAQDLPQNAHIVSVRAVYDIMYGGYAWYDINFVNNEKWMDEAQAVKSRNKLVEFIDAIVSKENLDSENVTLMGFSQGAILSYAIALNYPDKIKNVAILSGYPEPKIIGDFDQKKDFSNLNFFVSHGVEDVVLPIEMGRTGEEFLNSLNIKSESREYRSGHGIAPQNYYDLMDWIKRF